MVRLVVRSLYVLLAMVFLFGGVTVLLLGTGLLPASVSDVVLSVGEDNPHTLHIMQEYATLLVLVALVTFWFVKHYEQSRAFHWIMTVFWGIIALIHWFDPKGNFHSGLGELINTVPFLLFAAAGLLRERSERQIKAG
jgi:cell division protein FtsW (lipid II flippase)